MKFIKRRTDRKSIGAKETATRPENGTREVICPLSDSLGEHVEEVTVIDQNELRYFPSALRDFSKLPNLEHDIVTEQHFKTVPSLVCY